jgi:hypothetical protein
MQRLINLGGSGPKAIVCPAGAEEEVSHFGFLLGASDLKLFTCKESPCHISPRWRVQF